MAQKNPCQGKHREFGNFVKTQGKRREFCLNTGKTQGVLLAQVVNVLILKVKDIAIVAAKKKSIFFPEAGSVCQVSSMYVILANYVNWHRENLQSDRENTGNLKIQFEWVPCIQACKLVLLIQGYRTHWFTITRALIYRNTTYCYKGW